MKHIHSVLIAFVGVFFLNGCVITQEQYTQDIDQIKNKISTLETSVQALQDENTQLEAKIDKRVTLKTKKLDEAIKTVQSQHKELKKNMESNITQISESINKKDSQQIQTLQALKESFLSLIQTMIDQANQAKQQEKTFENIQKKLKD